MGNLQKAVVDHWIIQPPCSFDDLPDDVKQTNTYSAVDIHGIHWFEGNINLRNLHRHLYNIARVSTRIYVRGEEEARYIEMLLGRRICNLETFESPTFGKLDRIFPQNSVCVTHSLKYFKQKKGFCALFKAIQIKKWLHSILPTEWRSVPWNKVHSEMYFVALCDYRSELKKKVLQFAEKSDDDDYDDDDP